MATSDPASTILDNDEDNANDDVISNASNSTNSSPKRITQRQGEPQPRDPLHRAIPADPVVERSPPLTRESLTELEREQREEVRRLKNNKNSNTEPKKHPMIPGKSSSPSPPKKNSRAAATPVAAANKKQQQQQQQPQQQTESSAVTAASQELERLLIDKVAECHRKEDLVAALKRHCQVLESDLSERMDFVDKLKMELGLVQESLRLERTARKAAEEDLALARDQSAELRAVREALECFNTSIPAPRRGGQHHQKQQQPANNGSNLAEDVSALGRAFLALQLDMIRTFSWAAASIYDQWTSGQQLIIEAEHEHFLFLFSEFEQSARLHSVCAEEERLRSSKIAVRRAQTESRLIVSQEMLLSHERDWCRGVAALADKAMSEWTALGALHIESTRKASAVKLRQANALVAKARDETEEKNKLLEESRRTMNLLKARFEATRKERAAAAAIGKKLGEREQEEKQRLKQLEEQQRKEQQEILLYLQRHEVPTQSSASKARVQHNFEIIDSPVPNTMTTRGNRTQHQQQQQSHSRISSSGAVSSTPPPPGQQQQPIARRISFVDPNQPQGQAQQQQQAQQVMSGAATPADVHHQRFAEAMRQLEMLNGKVSQLEDVLDKKDEVIVKLRQERSELDKECDNITAQCRLLEQACRFGAKAMVELRIGGTS